MKLNSKMRKFKMTKKMMAFSIASAGLMAGAVAVAIFTTSCSKTYTLNSIDQNNADTSNRKFDKGNKMIINRDLIQAVCPCYCYLRTQLSNNTTSLQTNYAFFQNSSTYNYKLLHTGATIYVLQIGGSSLMGVNVWDASDVKKGLAKYSLSNYDYHYSSQTDSTLTSDSKWVESDTVRVRKKNFSFQHSIYYYSIDASSDGGATHTYSLSNSTSPPQNTATTTYYNVHIGSQIVAVSYSFYIWQELK